MLNNYDCIPQSLISKTKLSRYFTTNHTKLYKKLCCDTYKKLRYTKNATQKAEIL